MQLDIFDDSHDVLLRNDVVQAIERRDVAAARRAWHALATELPADDGVPLSALLIDALEDAARTDAFSDDAAGRAALSQAAAALRRSVEPAARRLLGEPAGTAWMKPLWRRLAQRAAALSWRAAGPASRPDGVDSGHDATSSSASATSALAAGGQVATDAAAPRISGSDDTTAHAAPLWLLAGEWQAAENAVGQIESWRRIPAPLAWMAEARCRRHGLDDAWPLLAELAWLAPVRFDALASSLADPLLARLRHDFGAAFDGDGTADDWAWFPAWLLTEKPALASRLATAQPSQQTPPESAMRLLVELLGLERQGRHHDVVARRRALRDSHAGLYAAYLRTR